MPHIFGSLSGKAESIAIACGRLGCPQAFVTIINKAACEANAAQNRGLRWGFSRDGIETHSYLFHKLLLAYDVPMPSDSIG